MNTVRIKVIPDIENDPKVKLDDRAAHADEGDRIEWVLQDPRNYRMRYFEGNLRVFKELDLDSREIVYSCVFRPVADEHPYTIWIESRTNGCKYDSDKDVMVHEGKLTRNRAVIRN